MNSQTFTGNSQVYLSMSSRKPTALVKALDVFSCCCENPSFVHQLTTVHQLNRNWKFLFPIMFWNKVYDQ